MWTGHYYFDEMRTWFNISFLLSRNSTFRNKPPKISVITEAAAAVQKKGT
jgi:hypothetical protein